MKLFIRRGSYPRPVEVDHERRVLEPGVLETRVHYPGVLEIRVVEPGVLEPGVHKPGFLETRVLEPSVLEPSVLEPSVLETRVRFELQVTTIRLILVFQEWLSHPLHISLLIIETEFC